MRIKHGDKSIKHCIHLLKVFSIIKKLFPKLSVRLAVRGAQRPFLGLSCSIFFDSNVLGSEKYLA